MLQGRFGNTSGRPYLETRIIIPRLRIQGDFSLLVDTGADKSLLMPGAGLTLGLDYAALLNRSEEARGAGGRLVSFSEEAWLVFSDEEHLYAYSVQLGILDYDAEMLPVPSLLGRDVIQRWRMVDEPSAERLEVEPISADVILPSRGPAVEPSIRHE